MEISGNHAGIAYTVTIDVRNWDHGRCYSLPITLRPATDAPPELVARFAAAYPAGETIHPWQILTGDIAASEIKLLIIARALERVEELRSDLGLGR